MSSRRNVQNDGCWTCKLRRKRCDRVLPSCSNCKNLKIDCIHGSKPAWMDGGVQQKQRTVSFKEKIKRNVAQEREKARLGKNGPVEAAGRYFEVIADMSINDVSPIPRSKVATGSKSHPTYCEAQQTSTEEPTLLATLPWGAHQHRRSDTLEQASPNEWNFIMKYIDFIFPALFPSYQPHIFDTGRSWLLILLRHSNIAYHAVLGLSCYYFTMALSDADEDGELAECRQLRWKEVDVETERCFASLRTDIVALTDNAKSRPVSMVEKVELMNSITQVIIFEMTIGKVIPWNTHLHAALSLFEEIMSSSESQCMYRGRIQSRFASVLLGLGEPLWTNPWPSNHIWSPIQAGFRFYTGLLVSIDILASTATGQTPRLLSYHADILATNSKGVSLAGEAEIRLSHIIGCPNHVAVWIAKISGIVAWKRSPAETGGSLPNESETILSCATITQELRESIDAMTTDLTAFIGSHRSSDGMKALDLLMLDSKEPARLVNALVWALATRLYLTSIISKSPRSDSSAQADVVQILRLLKRVTPTQRRNLAWPIYVTGCLAADANKLSMRELFAGLSKTVTVGALDDALQMLEQIWERNKQETDHEVDIISCFAILGSPILLV